jgi:hypothetical protein
VKLLIQKVGHNWDAKMPKVSLPKSDAPEARPIRS